MKKFLARFFGIPENEVTDSMVEGYIAAKEEERKREEAIREQQFRFLSENEKLLAEYYDVD